MKTIQHIFQLNLSAKEVVWSKRILAIVMLPILVFYMSSMNILVGGMTKAQAADGSGTMTVDDDNVTAGGAAQSFKFTFDPSEDMDLGSVRIEFPSPFPEPTETNDANGEIIITEKSGANLDLDNVSISGRKVTIPITTMAANEYFTVTYNVTSTMPTTIGDYEFTTESKLADGSFNGLNDSRQASVEIEAGPVASYQISTIADQTVGVNFPAITITAKDANGNKTNGSASVNILVKTGTGNLAGDISANTSTDGDDTVVLKYDKVEDGVKLEADDGTIDDDSNAFDVDNMTAPTFSSPGSSTNDSTPLINWSDVSGTGVEYTMKLKARIGGDCTTENYETDLLLDETPGDSQYQVAADEALLDETTYCVKVTATDDYTNPISAYKTFNLLTSKPAAPAKDYIEADGGANGYPENYINIYNNENVSVKVYHAGTLDGGKVYVKIKDGLSNETSEYNASISGAATNTTVSGIDASSLQQGTNLEIYARVEDAGTNSSDWATTTTSGGASADVVKDTSAPARPTSITFIDNPINAGNDDTVNIQVVGEGSTTAYYSITSSGGGAAVTGNFVMDGDGDTNSPNINLTSLGDGTLTASVYLADTALNHSNGKTGTVTKDAAAPDVALTYNPNHAVKDADTMNITATFTEDMQATPTIAINYADAGCADLGAFAMTIGANAGIWTYAVDVPTCATTTTATVTISGQDLVGNPNNAATNNTFTVDNQKPTVTGAVTEDPAAAGTVHVSLTFNENMDQSVAPTVTIDTAGSAQTLAVSGSYSNATTWTGTTTVESGNANGVATLKISEAKDVAGNTMDARNDVDTFTIDTNGPIFTVVNDTETGPVKTDTINITVADATGSVASQFYGFSSDATCNGGDTIITAFTSGGDFSIAENHTDYLCVKATDNAGNISYETVGQLNTDNLAPTLSPVHIVSNNSTNTNKAKTGDTVTLTFTSSETIQIPTVTITEDVPATLTNSGNLWTATYVMVGGDVEGVISFTIDFSDIATNVGAQVIATTDASSVTFDKSAPSTLTVSSPDTSDNQTFTVSYTASDSGPAGVGFAKLYYRVDGGGWTVFDIVSADDYQAYPGSFNFIAPQAGNYDFYVQVKDNAGNESSAQDVNDSTDARPATVYVCTSGDCGHASNWDAYNTIQAGINAIREGASNTVNVEAGTYAESITINKAVTVDGVGPTTIVDPAVDSNGFLISADNVTVQDLKITLATSGVDAQAIRLEGANSVTISGNTIETTGNKGVGIWIGGVPYSNSNNLTISGNTITIADESTGIYAERGATAAQSSWSITGNTITANNGNPLELYDVTNSTVSGNTLTTTALGGANVIWNAETHNISNLVFSNNIVNGSNGSQVVIGTGLKEPASANTITTVTISGNTFSNWGSRALRIGKIAGTGTVTGVTAHTNKFLSAGQAINNFDAAEVNAENNWWGSNQKSTIESKIAGSVDFTPWYLSDAMAVLSSSDTTGPAVVLTNSISERTEVSDPDNVTITATFSDANGLDTGVNPTITISNGGVTGASMTATADLNIWTYLWNVPSGDFATASVTVAAKDIVGNDAQAPTGINSYVIDNTAPTSTLSGTPGDPTNATALDVTVGGLGVVSYKYKLDLGTYGSAIPIATHITDSGLGEGAHTLYAKGIDAAGNEQPGETTHSWTIDISAPSVALTYGPLSPVKAGTVTVTATYTEDVKTGETPQISIDQPGSTDIANVAMTIGADRQHWTYPYTVNTANGGAYVDGTATVSLSTNHDEAGNPAGSPSNSTFMIDTTAPVATLNALTPDPNNDNTPSFTGNVTDSATVLTAIQYHVDAGPWTGVTIADGALDEVNEDFNFTIAGVIDGPHTVYVIGTDSAGNDSVVASDTFSIDIVPPTVTGANINVTGNTGTGGKFKRGNVVNVAWNSTGSGDNQSDIASVSVSFAEFGGGSVVATNSAGTWSANYVLANDINLTGKKVSVTAVDTATNSTTTDDNATFDVDTLNPTAPTVNMSDPVNDTNKSGITLAGSGDVSGTLNYSIVSSGGGGTISGTIAIDGAGAYSNVAIDVTALPDGTLTATAYVTDTAGNNSPTATDTATKDISHPTIADVNSTHIDGSFKAGESIDINVTFSENVTSSGLVTVSLDSGGSCTFSVSNSSTESCSYVVADGQNSPDLTTSGISGTVADQNGNAMTNFAPAVTLAFHKAIVIDTVAPGAPTVTAPASPITVNEDNYSVQGAAEANALVKVYRGGGVVGSQQLSGGGISYSISVSLNQDVANDFTVKATDAAGNEGVGQAVPTITEDSANPVVNVGVDEIKNALFAKDATVTDSSALTYLWSKQSGPGTVTFSAASSEDTNISANTDGTYVIRLTAVDAAGNSNYDEFTLIWDTTLPTSTGGSPTYDTAGTINVTFTTGADLSGVAQVQLWYKFNAGAWTNTGLTSALTSGTFAFTPADGDGTYYFATKAVDNATNAEADPAGSGDDNTIYDTVNPTAPSGFAVTGGAPYDTWSATSNTAISWTASTDATSGLDGYNVKWDKVADTSLQANRDPSDGSVWVEQTVSTSSKTFDNDGEWYFHIKPSDNATNWGATTHYGPFKIDTTDPNISHSVVSEGTAGMDIHISADVADDGSGVKSVKVYYKHHGDSFSEHDMTCDGSWNCTYDIPDEENSDYDVDYYIKALDNVDNDAFDGTSGSPHTVDIVSAALDHFTFIYPTSGTRYAGIYFTTVVEARDQFNNVATQFDGSGDKVNFTTDESGVSVFVEDESGNTSGAFDQGIWGGRIEFGTGAVTPSENDIVLTATDTDSTDNGSVTMTTSGTDFGTTGTVAGEQQNGGEVQGEEIPQGIIPGEGVEGEQTALMPSPWKQAWPYEAGAAGVLLLGSGIWWWLRRGGKGIGGGHNITGFIFSTLKTVASKARMFFW